MKKIFFILILISCISSNSFAYERGVNFSFGIKLAHQSGENGGFLYGIEVSTLTNINPYLLFGFVLDYDFCKGKTFIHPGLEFATLYGGIEIGPTFVSENIQKFQRAWTANIYTGAMIYPFYGITYYPGLDSITQQYGIYFKPIFKSSSQSHLVE